MIVTETGLTTRDILANRFGLVSRMADDIAHEIKNPLHSMAINLEVMRRRVAAGDRQVALERAAVLETELHRVNELVDRLLRLVRPSSGDMRTADVDRTLGEIMPLLAARARLARVPFEFEPIGAPVLAAVAPTSLTFAVLNAAQEIFDVARAGVGRMRVSATAQPLGIRIEASLSAEVVLAATQPDRSIPAAGVRFADAILKGSGGAATFEEERADAVAVRLVLPGGASA